jgi:hypothetical protein
MRRQPGRTDTAYVEDIMSQNTARTLANDDEDRPGPKAIDADPLDGMLDEVDAPRGDAPYDEREVSQGRSRSPHPQQTVPRAVRRGTGAPRHPDALDQLIELATMLDPEDWLRKLTAKTPR